MAIYNTPDGRQVVGSVESGNDYHGFNGKRDIIIQLTADGATTDGLNALEYLKAYAIEQNKQNKPIFPNGTRVFISANGYTKAVEADDIVIDGDNITIGGIVWNGSTWDYTNAGQSGGGGLPPVTAYDAGKVLAVDNSGEWVAQNPIGELFIVTLTPTAEDFSGTMDKTVAEINEAYEAGRKIVFRLYDSDVAHYDIALAFARQNSDRDWYYVFYILDAGNNIIINAYTTENASGNSYSTKVYALTPAT